MKDIVINKIQSIQRCVRRAREEYQADREGFETNYTRQDAAMLNVVRACETSIDLANYVIRTKKLGIPVSSADSFKLLRAEGIIDDRLAGRMEKMTGFRNTVVHQYTKVDIRIVEAVITTELDELLAFADRVREYISGAE
ncbi:MAG TPA: DUF86 domain-containing protein [Bryobacteraceae bacterium]|nr:DUF86 domain-containing protein [Bryobacteraceae bacterium]HPT27450.1 DUF86 domain-containing protein [Bryobacteraceae bacterium]